MRKVKVMNKLRNTLISKGFLAAILLVVALPAAAQNLDPSRWNDTMAGFAEQDRMHPQPEGAILLTGSSSIARWNDQAAKALAPLTVIPRGFGGSVMGDVLYHLDDVALKYKPRAILIYEGDNDTIYHIPEEKIVRQFQEIVGKVHAALPETRIYVLSVKPSIARVSVWDAAQRVSANIKSIANHDPLVHYVDVANPFLKANGKVMTDIFVEDNLHLNDMGNLIWGAAIRAALMPIEIRYE
jgi:lysophospholipase L1-like esterase|tara:strand:- start:354 stop:1076 length:723 start_codon:yes stop_codon:yes gene_type:complete